MTINSKSYLLKIEVFSAITRYLHISAKKKKAISSMRSPIILLRDTIKKKLSGVGNRHEKLDSSMKIPKC